MYNLGEKIKWGILKQKKKKKKKNPSEEDSRKIGWREN
jgi:hypothetical protein